MADEFDIGQAEGIVMTARAAIYPGHGHDRITEFPVVVEWLGKSIMEVKRLRAGRAALIAEALTELNGLITAQLEEAIYQHGTLLDAVHEFRDRNYQLIRDADGKLRWKHRPDSEIHAAIEKLSSAAVRAQRAQQ